MTKEKYKKMTKTELKATDKEIEYHHATQKVIEQYFKVLSKDKDIKNLTKGKTKEQLCPIWFYIGFTFGKDSTRYGKLISEGTIFTLKNEVKTLEQKLKRARAKCK